MWVLRAAGRCGIAAVLLVAAGCTARPTAGRSQPSPRPSVPSAAALDGFRPASVSFVSAARGWALGTDCPAPARGCPPVVVGTADGGRSWRRLATLPGRQTGAVFGGEDHIAFADARHGVIAGARTWRTGDGGRHWVADDLPGTVLALRAGPGTVSAVSARCIARSCGGPQLWTARPAGGWRRAALPARPKVPADPGIALDLADGYAVLGRPRRDPGVAPVYRRTGGRWALLRTPCTRLDGTGWPVAAAAAGDRVALLCSGEAMAGSTQKRLYRSDDRGRRLVGRPPSDGAPGTVALGSAGYVLATAGDVEQLLVSPAGAVVAGRPDVGSVLLLTGDAGRHWRRVAFGGRGAARAPDGGRAGLASAR